MISAKLYIDFSLLGISSFPCRLNSNYSLHNYIDFNRLLDNFVPGWFQITFNESIMTIDIKTSILQHLEIDRNCFSFLLHRLCLPSVHIALTQSSSWPWAPLHSISVEDRQKSTVGFVHLNPMMSMSVASCDKIHYPS